MNPLPIPLLTSLILLPAIGAGLILLMRKDEEGAIRGAALTTAIVTFLASLPLFWLYATGAAAKDAAAGGIGVGSGAAGATFQLIESVEWIKAFGIRYAVGVDGISLMLVLLTTFLGPITVLASWTSIDKRVKEFFAALLFLESAVIGVFCAMDLVLFYVFWEVMLVPMFLLIGVWGGENRIYATLKFFLYTMAGSLLMLVAILYVYFRATPHFKEPTFEIAALAKVLGSILNPGEQFALFVGFALTFAIKVPIFPFHTWLPDAHTEAPTAGSVVLAAVLLKMGAYGLIRIAIPFFPGAAVSFMPLLTGLALIGIIYGALMAIAQTDVKRLIAYSSVSHLGFVVLGIAAWNEKALLGAVYQMLGHGLSTGALFLFVGAIYERRHTRRLADYGGVAKAAPGLAAVFVIVSLASMGLPGLNGFVGEFLILLGSFQRNPLAASLAALGVILGAVYLLMTVQRMMFGPVKSEADRTTPDLTAREYAYFVPLILLMAVMGLFPTPFLERIAGSVHAVISSASLKGY